MEPGGFRAISRWLSEATPPEQGRISNPVHSGRSASHGAVFSHAAYRFAKDPSSRAPRAGLASLRACEKIEPGGSPRPMAKDLQESPKDLHERDPFFHTLSGMPR